MSSRVIGITNTGISGVLIDVECHVSNGLPGIVIVGFANKAVDEAKERIRGAFANSQLQLPRKRITINLAPADLPKDSTGFDLAMATSVMMAGNQISRTVGNDEAFIGELGLDGSVRPVRGIIGKLLAGREKGINRFFLPKANYEQGLLVPHITILPLENLHEMYLHLTKTLDLPSIDTKAGRSVRGATTFVNPSFSLSDVVGQQQAKRALEIVAAGGHNILLNGPPGTGKSMLAKALPSILPELSHEEMLEVTHLHSLANKDYGQIVGERPFRAPHHSASDIAIIGGGQDPRPGEISLSHRGVLFFDEFPEFSRSSIEALRQPLEDKMITVARAKDSVNYPANFILVATANPCPCGYYGTAKPCQCLPNNILRYQRKVSGPIIDRIDLYVAVEEVAHERLLSSSNQNKAIENRVKQRVERARQKQHERYHSNYKLNADMTNRDIKRYSQLSSEAKSTLDSAANQLDISARSYMRAIKVARTIADLEAATEIAPHHVAEALQYRTQRYQLQPQ